MVTATQRALEFDSASCWSARTGGHLRTTSTFAKLGWLASEGEVLSGSFLGLAGLLVRTWTGTSWQESSLAATSGAYDPVARKWLRRSGGRLAWKTSYCQRSGQPAAMQLPTDLRRCWTAWPGPRF